MATTTNYSWVTPDDTSLVKDGAAAIRSLGTSVDTTTKALNPSTTLGDIEYRSSTANTNTRLGIGTTGQVLTVAGGVPTWASAGASATSFTLLNAGGTALTGATTVTISGLSGYNTLLIYASDIGLSGTGTTATVRFNADSTSGNYLQEGLNLTSGTTIGRLQASSTSATSLRWMTTNTGGEDSYGFMMVYGANGTGWKPTMQNVGASGASGVGNYGSGVYKGTSVISSMSFISSSGNWTDGTVFIYGGN